MRFEHKAALQHVLSRMPGGEHLNYAFQRHLTHTLPRPEAGFANKVFRAAEHLGHLKRYSPTLEFASAQFLEIGAGWDLAIPLTYAMCGVGHQALIDHVPHFRLELINHSLARIEQYRSRLESELGLETRGMGGPVKSATELADRFGIVLHAPMDARKVALPDDSVDFISSTSTMEHLYVEQIPDILREWHRLLRPEGLVSCHIDLKDHYYSGDRRISYYNFLRYDPSEWRKYNPPMHHQNRLRAPDFQSLFADQGFALLEATVDGPTPEDEMKLAALRIHPDFQHFSVADLGAKIVWIVARPR